MVHLRRHVVVTEQPCGSCGGGRFVLGHRTSLTADRPLVPCASCDDGAGPTGKTLVPGRPPLRQRVVFANRRMRRRL